MRITIFKNLLLGCVAFPLIAWGEVSERDIADALSVFPRAEIVAQRDADVEDYSLALGEMKKIRDRWRPERELRVAGSLQRKTMQIPDGHRAREAFDFYRRKMRTFNARILFECEARICGSSNAWANEQFNDKLLYGLDDEQTYGIYEIADTEGLLNYVALYTVARGNRRVYAHIEWLQTSNKLNESVAPSGDEISSNFQDLGYYIVRGVGVVENRIVIDQEHLQAIVDAMRKNRRLNFHIVGHSYANRPLEQQQELSLDYAQQFQALLVQQGIAAPRLSVYGVGSLAPAGQNFIDQSLNFRIEVVVAKP